MKVEMSLVSCATSRVDSSRSFATLVASLPVSFWTFCKPGRSIETHIVQAADADLNVGLYLYAQFLEVLDYRSVNGTTKVGVLICNNTSLVPDAIVHILK